MIKVCGITSVEDGQIAIDAGATALGFNFYTNSPRFIPVHKAAEIVRALRGAYERVGVFVNASSEDLDRAVDAVPLDVVQIHGSTCAHPKRGAVRLWRSIEPGVIPERDARIEAWLIDTPSAGFGGSGQNFAWARSASFPYRAIVAGGLEAANVTAAIRDAAPWGVDACSRLELAPGRKDAARVRAFVQAAKAAFASLQQEATL